MAGGFGFVKQPQRPAPDPREVGAALAQQGQMQAPMGGGQAMPGPMLGRGAAPMLDADQDTDQIPDMDADDAGGLDVAIANAEIRVRGGAKPDTNPYIDRERRMRDVARLGISPFEAMLLARTGGL